jgi:3-hydroxybutyryl-CoA dehydratase
MAETYQSRGLYFEEFEIGQRVTTVGRTITEGDIVAFAGMSGDYNQIHTDVEFSKSTPFGQRIAHGLLVLSIASGLIAQSGLLDGTVIAFREIENWKFTKPTYIGDTIHVVAEITDTKALRRLGGGSVDLELSVLNQDDEVVMKGVWKALMASKPSTDE